MIAPASTGITAISRYAVISHIQQNSGIALRGIAILFRNDALQLTEAHAVFVRHVGLLVERIALGQLEYRSDLRLSVSQGSGESRRTRFRADGAWVFFADAGRGWLVNAPGNPLNYERSDLPPLSTYRTDLGLGLDFDLFGIYLAKALSVPTEPLNLSVRVRHRF